MKLVAALNACHLVLEDSVTDRALGEGGKRGSERASELKSRPTLAPQSLNLHIVM